MKTYEISYSKSDLMLVLAHRDNFTSTLKDFPPYRFYWVTGPKEVTFTDEKKTPVAIIRTR